MFAPTGSQMPIDKQHLSAIAFAWLFVVLFKLAVALHLLLDQTLWLQYKIGYFISAAIDAAVILYLLYRIRGPFKVDGSPIPLGVWGWVWRTLVSGYARLLLLAPFVYFALPRTSPHQQTAVDLLLLVIPGAVFAAIAIWLLYAPKKAERFRSLLRLPPRSERNDG
jgi:hypothetical protein